MTVTFLTLWPVCRRMSSLPAVPRRRLCLSLSRRSENKFENGSVTTVITHAAVPTPNITGTGASSSNKRGLERDANSNEPAKRQRLPDWYAPVLHVPKDIRLEVRLRADTGPRELSRDLRRGALPSGWRPIVRLKRLRREYLKTESFLATAPTAQAKINIKRNGLARADRVVPNLSCLESLLFTRFVEFEVKAAVWAVAEQKTFQCCMRSLQDIGGKGVGMAWNSRFMVMQHAREYVVIDAGRPVEFASFAELISAAGGLQNIVHEQMLRNALRVAPDDPIESVHLAEYCRTRTGASHPVTGICAFPIRKRFYPWVSTGMTDNAVVANWQRVRRAMAIMENVWTRVGVWKHVLAPFPDAWTGGRPDTQ
jgi:hypothetical protein